MARDLVSIIIPCFQQARFLPEALESVLAQSHRAIQPIVVDDGSDDDPAAAIRPFGAKVDFVVQTNQGASAARNRGIKQAEGKYLLFLDADDRLHPDAVAWLMDAMQAREDRLCVMWYRSFRQDPRQDGRDECLAPPDATALPALIHVNFGPPSCFLASKAAVTRAGSFDEAILQGCEEWDLWLRVVLQGATMKTVPRVGAYYRRHPTSASAQLSRMLYSRAEVLLKLHRYLIDQPPLLQRWGPDLLQAEHRVRKRCMVQKAPPRYIQALGEAMLELTGRGFRFEESLPKTLLRRVLGTHADRWALATLAALSPRQFAKYKNGYT